jgi:hypothetical protein
MCTIIFIAKIALQYQIKPEFHVGFAPWISFDGTSYNVEVEVEQHYVIKFVSDLQHVGGFLRASPHNNAGW